MIKYLLFVLYCFSCGEAGSFKDLLAKKYMARQSPKLLSLGRQADPCRIKTISGRSGGLPNSAEKIIARMEMLSEYKKKSRRKQEKISLKQRLAICSEALQNSRNVQFNVRVCSEALAEIKKSPSLQFGRSGSNNYDDEDTTSSSESVEDSWDVLYNELLDTITENDILAGLDLMGAATLGLLIDNTGSMSNDISQVTRIIENFVDASIEAEIANYVIMSYGDPYYETATSYLEPDEAKYHLQSKIVPSMGGDCPEMMCSALEELVTYAEIYSWSPIFVFTDASSKDCTHNLAKELGELGSDFGYIYNFILTGVCENNEVDGNYTDLAGATGGSVYRISEDEIYTMKEIIRDSVEAGALIAHGTFGDSKRKKRSISSGVSIYIDETVGKLTMEVTVEDSSFIKGLEFQPKFPCSDSAEHVEETKIGNFVYYKVDCPCIGEWMLKIPHYLTNKWSFKVKTYGEHSIEFDVSFEQNSRGGHVEMIKNPCSGERTTIWLTMFQNESIDKRRSIQMFFNSVDGSYTKSYRLLRSEDNDARYFVDVLVPDRPFEIAIRGKTVMNNFFLRIYQSRISPLSTCLKTEQIRQASTIKAGGESMIVMSLSNNKEEKTYNIYCMNNRDKDGYYSEIHRPRDAVLAVKPKRLYYFFVKVRAPPTARVGDTVMVNCYALYDKTHNVRRSVTLIVSSVLR